MLRHFALAHVKYGFAIDQHRAALGRKDAVDALNQRRFARAINAQNTQQLAWLHAKADIIQNRRAAVGKINTRYGQFHGAALIGSS